MNMKRLWSKEKIFKKVKPVIIMVVLFSVLSGSVMTVQNKKAQALCTPCVLCIPFETNLTVLVLNIIQEFMDNIIEDNIEDHLNQEENWIVEDFFEDFWLPALAELTEFLGAFGVYQVEMVGAFFDAKSHLETRRLLFELHAEANKDYHVSDDFCWFGTQARSLASSESRARVNLLALSERALQRHIGYEDSSSADNIQNDANARWAQFVNTYCDPKDNNWNSAGSGLDFACDRDGVGGGTAAGATDRARVNIDIDYTRLVEIPRTLDIDFTNNTAATPDEEDVMALSANLYGNRVLTQRFSQEQLEKHKGARSLYNELRGAEAGRSIATHSFNSIVAMKSAGTGSSATGTPQTGSYAAAIVRELMPPGTPDEEIFAIMGENPSYYAQLEILGKKIYQDPKFFANLYDKPANVERKSVAMKAIELMIDRALFESELRQEMMMSVMLASELRQRQGEINRDLSKNDE